MTVYRAPDSLVSYFGDSTVREATDAALARFASPRQPASLTWEQSRGLNDAILMATRIRRDLVEMHYAVWEATWGVAIAEASHPLGPENREFEEMTPQFVWTEREVWRGYRRAASSEAQAEDAFYVFSGGDRLRLQVARWDVQGDARPADELARRVSWRPVDYEFPVAESDGFEMMAFLREPDRVLERLLIQAREAVSALTSG